MTNTIWSSPPTLAKRYGIKPDKVLTWIASGELEAVNVAERSTGRPRWRISEEAIEDFERRRSSKPEPRQVRKPRRRKIPKYV